MNSFFRLLSAFLRLVQWLVWASYRVRSVLSFCLFVFPLMSLAERNSNPVCWWLGLYFCFAYLDEASCTVWYWWLGDTGSSIQVPSFVWVLNLLFPRVSSLVVWGVGVSAPTPKAQGSSSGQERRFHKWFSMALSEIKTNIQNQEAKDELQKSGRYKIRQIIIKIMKYTHIHIHPWAKWIVQQKYSRLTCKQRKSKIIFTS